MLKLLYNGLLCSTDGCMHDDGCDFGGYDSLLPAIYVVLVSAIGISVLIEMNSTTNDSISPLFTTLNYINICSNIVICPSQMEFK